MFFGLMFGFTLFIIFSWGGGGYVPWDCYNSYRNIFLLLTGVVNISFHVSMSFVGFVQVGIVVSILSQRSRLCCEARCWTDSSRRPGLRARASPLAKHASPLPRMCVHSFLSRLPVERWRLGEGGCIPVCLKHFEDMGWDVKKKKAAWVGWGLLLVFLGFRCSEQTGFWSKWTVLHRNEEKSGRSEQSSLRLVLPCLLCCSPWTLTPPSSSPSPLPGEVALPSRKLHPLSFC